MDSVLHFLATYILPRQLSLIPTQDMLTPLTVTSAYVALTLLELKSIYNCLLLTLSQTTSRLLTFGCVNTEPWVFFFFLNITELSLPTPYYMPQPPTQLLTLRVSSFPWTLHPTHEYLAMLPSKHIPTQTSTQQHSLCSHSARTPLQTFASFLPPCFHHAT